MELLTQAKAAQAGVELMVQIIDHIETRRPDLVADAAEKVLGVKSTAGDDVFNAAMGERVEAVTCFDHIADHIAELEADLEAALEQVDRLARGK